MIKNPCPVCGYSLSEPAADCDICPCCGTQFGYSDSGRSHAQLRDIWVLNGALWWSRTRQRPPAWNPWMQLIAAGHPEAVPFKGTLTVQASTFFGGFVRRADACELLAVA